MIEVHASIDMEIDFYKNMSLIYASLGERLKEEAHNDFIETLKRYTRVAAPWVSEQSTSQKKIMSGAEAVEYYKKLKKEGKI